ncbi:MAG: hypothetical protein ACYTE3_27750 [Planctomycetota bacterium]|jgi:hypothetical protein
MRKTEEITLTMPLLVLAIVCLLSLPVGAQYGGGTGEPDDPYLIYTAEQMNEIGANFRTDWDKHFKLMANIDMSAYVDRSFNIIGSNNNNAFRGVFDGNGKRIWNLTYTATNRSYAGLFGYLKGSQAEIRNLELVNPRINAGTGSYVGSLVGFNEERIIPVGFLDPPDMEPSRTAPSKAAASREMKRWADSREAIGPTSRTATRVAESPAVRL